MQHAEIEDVAAQIARASLQIRDQCSDIVGHEFESKRPVDIRRVTVTLQMHGTVNRRLNSLGSFTEKVERRCKSNGAAVKPLPSAGNEYAFTERLPSDAASRRLFGEKRNSRFMGIAPLGTFSLCPFGFGKKIPLGMKLLKQDNRPTAERR